MPNSVTGGGRKSKYNSQLKNNSEGPNSNDSGQSATDTQRGLPPIIVPPLFSLPHLTSSTSSACMAKVPLSQYCSIGIVRENNSGFLTGSNFGEPRNASEDGGGGGGRYPSAFERPIPTRRSNLRIVIFKDEIAPTGVTNPPAMQRTVNVQLTEIEYMNLKACMRTLDGVLDYVQWLDLQYRPVPPLPNVIATSAAAAPNAGGNPNDVAGGGGVGGSAGTDNYSTVI